MTHQILEGSRIVGLLAFFVDDFAFTLFVTNLYFTFTIANLFSVLSSSSFSMVNLFFSLADLLLIWFVVFVADLSLTEFLSIGRFPFERSYHTLVLLCSISLISSSISSRHFSSCTSSAVLRSFSICNCSCKLETSSSNSKHHFCKTCFFHSKLACRIKLSLTSFSILYCKSPFAISNLWIRSSSSSNS